METVGNKNAGHTLAFARYLARTDLELNIKLHAARIA